jgi:glycosyltransferase involved in cell wall biosynthesis
MLSLVSVVIPVYNTEKYLIKCIDSVLNQTYKNIEIILVDDGSKDSCPAICDRYALLDKRIKVIHKENGGVSDSRNAGIRSANGDYITFIDSDDLIETEMLETAVKEMEKTCSDVVVWGYCSDNVNENEFIISTKVHLPVPCLCSKGSNSDFFLDNVKSGITGYVWNKLYRLDLIKKYCVTFEKDLPLFEDMIFNSAILVKAKQISFIPIAFSHYIQRNSTTLGKKLYNNHYELKMKACEAKRQLLLQYGVNETKVSEYASNDYFTALKSTFRQITKSNLRWDEKKNRIIHLLNANEIKSIIKLTSVKSIKDRLIYYLIKLKLHFVILMMWR